MKIKSELKNIAVGIVKMGVATGPRTQKLAVSQRKN